MFDAYLSKKSMALQTIIPVSQSKKGGLEAFAGKLLDKTIHADTPMAVERYTAVAVKALGNNKVNGYIIQRFIDRVTKQLDNYQPLNPKEVANISMAKEKLRFFRVAIAQPVK